MHIDLFTILLVQMGPYSLVINGITIVQNDYCLVLLNIAVMSKFPEVATLHVIGCKKAFLETASHTGTYPK